MPDLARLTYLACFVVLLFAVYMPCPCTTLAAQEVVCVAAIYTF